MSLAIDPNDVIAVLLADGWHEVMDLGDWDWSCSTSTVTNT